MHIVEYECKKCKYSFTRLYKNKKEAKELREICKKCGGEVKTAQELDLSKNKPNCSSCLGCGDGKCKS